MKVNQWINSAFILELATSALFVYWANIEVFYSRPVYFNYLMYLFSLIIILIRIKNISVSHILIIFAALLISSISLLLPSGEYFSPYLFSFLLAGSLGVLISSLMKKPQLILLWQLAISIPISITAFGGYRESMGAEGSYMTTAYHLFSVFSVLILMFTFKGKKVIFFTSAFFVAILIIMTGARGAILAILLSIIITYTFKIHKMPTFKTAIILFVLIVLFQIIFVDFLNRIFTYLSNLIGFESRLLYLLENDNMFVSNSRIDIYSKVLKSFNDGNFFGSGLGSVPYMTEGKAYAHNFAIELLADFGIFSVIILYAFFMLLKKSIWHSTNDNYLIAGLFSIFVVVLPRLLSGSLLNSYTLPMIGVLTQIIRLNKYDYRINLLREHFKQKK